MAADLVGWVEVGVRVWNGGIEVFPLFHCAAGEPVPALVLVAAVVLAAKARPSDIEAVQPGGEFPRIETGFSGRDLYPVAIRVRDPVRYLYRCRRGNQMHGSTSLCSVL